MSEEEKKVTFPEVKELPSDEFKKYRQRAMSPTLPGTTAEERRAKMMESVKGKEAEAKAQLLEVAKRRALTTPKQKKEKEEADGAPKTQA